jgi:2,3-dihydroxy-p-cumate/2,3-dihydroxybenzoate 3,4-dioxygenase
VLYAAFEVERLDQIMQNSYFMRENQVKIVQGPGRQSASRQIFLHVEGPDGLILSYVNGITEVGDKPRPARHSRHRYFALQLGQRKQGRPRAGRASLAE